MKRKRCGNAKRKSRFICIECGKENHVVEGIQRLNQREYLHIKDCFCVICGHNTKNLEVRYCDDYNMVAAEIPTLQELYYKTS